MKTFIVSILLLSTNFALASYDAAVIENEFSQLKLQQGVEVSKVQVSNPENPIAHLGEWNNQRKVDYDHEIVEITFTAYDINIERDAKYGCMAAVNDNKLGLISLCRPLLDASSSWFNF